MAPYRFIHAEFSSHHVQLNDCPVISLASKPHTCPASSLISVSLILIHSLNAFLHWPLFPNLGVNVASRQRQSWGDGSSAASWSHSFGSLSGIWVFAREAEEEDEEDDEEELRRVSTPVLVIFSLRRLASGALSTLFRKKPSRLPLLNAWERQRQKKKNPPLSKSNKSDNNSLPAFWEFNKFRCFVPHCACVTKASLQQRAVWKENCLITPWMATNSQKYFPSVT